MSFADAMSEEHEHQHRPFSPRLAFILTNPLRRRLDPPHRLIDQVLITNEDTVVDFGCGPGYYTIEIARRARKTIGVDISEEMLRKAWRAAAKAGVIIEFLESNGESMELPSDSVDLILLVHVYHEIPDKEKALVEFRRILKSGGRVIIQERTRKSGLSRILPAPPVMDVNKIVDQARKVGLNQAKIEPYRGGNLASLVILRKT